MAHGRNTLTAVLFILLMFGQDGCTSGTQTQMPPTSQKVMISDREFNLELAVNDDQRGIGLGGRESIADDGGMLFVFRRAMRKGFVMRDCSIPIDIIFLGPRGEILAMYEMKVEPPRKSGESDRSYENRLPSYDSRKLAQFVIEIKGGTLKELDIDVGDRIELPYDDLKAMAE